jgi:NADPH-dependent ferric siderophore reductase
VYTPRRWDPDRLELDLDIVLHGEGPLSLWAAHAAPGDPVALAGPGGVYSPDPEVRWYLLAGDESAVPAIGTFLEVLGPDTHVEVIVEVQDTDDEQVLPPHPNARVRWVHRGPLLAGAALANSIHEVAFPDDRRWQAWVACESAAVRVIRRQLLADTGADARWVHTRGYWKYGSPNHPDHDMGVD